MNNSIIGAAVIYKNHQKKEELVIILKVYERSCLVQNVRGRAFFVTFDHLRFPLLKDIK